MLPKGTFLKYSVNVLDTLAVRDIQPSSNPRERKKGLVISVSEYDNHNLHRLDFCKNDGDEIHKILKSQGYDIPDNRKLIGRVEWDDMHDAIIDFFQDPNTKSKDTLVMYFSGHGIPDGRGSHYLASSDIEPSVPARRGVKFDDLYHFMDASISKKLVLMLDCCYSGAASLAGSSLGMSDIDSIAKSGSTAISNTLGKGFEEGRGRYILASSLSDQRSYGMEDQPYSLFTYHLLNGLRGDDESIDENGNVTPYLLGNYIYKKITDLPPEKRQYQVPIIKTEMSGDLVLARYPRRPIPQSPIPMDDSEQRIYILIEEGNNHFQRGNYDNAISCYEKARESSPYAIIPFYGDALLRKGNEFYFKGMLSEAMKYYDKALILNPNHVDSWYRKGNVLMKNGNYDEAIKCYTNTINVNPNFIEAWINKGACLHNLGKYGDAIFCYDRALSINERAIDVWKNKSITFSKMGNKGEAKRCLAKAQEFSIL